MGNGVSYEEARSWKAEEVAARVGGIAPSYAKYGAAVLENSIDGPMLLQLSEEVSNVTFSRYDEICPPNPSLFVRR